MNLKTKTNTVKQILARVMIVVLLAVSVLTLSSCSYVRFSGGTFTSHKEFQQFIRHFNSVNDGDISTFISFDFDKNNQLQNKQYEYHIEVLDRPLIKEDINENIPVYTNITYYRSKTCSSVFADFRKVSI